MGIGSFGRASSGSVRPARSAGGGHGGGGGGWGRGRRRRRRRGLPPHPPGEARRLLAAFDEGEDLALAQDAELLALPLDLGAGVLAVEDLVAGLDGERDALAVVGEAAGADG